MDGDGELREVVRRERQLLDPASRANSDLVGRLIHPDFVEHGASGRIWNRSSIIAALAADPGVSGIASNVEAVRLADDVVLVTYRIGGERASLRSSVWVHDPEAGWRLRFHQGSRTDHD
jgi:ribonuclease HI